MRIPTTIGFVDGENLVMRYQAMVAAGFKPRREVIHRTDTFVWHPKVSLWSMFDFSRINYYTSVTGDPPKVEALRDFICNVEYAFSYAHDDDIPDGTNNLVPHVFHKPSRNTKARNVDLQISIDVLRTANSTATDVLYILSGDGDYIPLIQEASRYGKSIWLAAFSSGLNPKLRHHVDTFQCLDDIFFVRKKAEKEGET
jgi:uncharacterized LabA/DUF88 family protein